MSNVLAPTLKLLNFNITWHAKVMKDTLIRYKIFVLFAILALAPTLSGAEYIITLPTRSLLSPTASSSQYIITLYAYLMIAMAWIALQRNILSYQPWDKYLTSLPLTYLQKSIYEGATLFVSDYLIWIPLLLAAYLEINSQSFEVFGMMMVIEKCITYVTFIVLLQLAYKMKQHRILILALALELPILYMAKMFQPNGAAVLLIFANVLSITLIPACFKATIKSLKSPTTKYSQEEADYHNFTSLLVFTRIQVKNLWSIKSELIFILIPLAAVDLVSFGFIKYTQDNNSITVILLSLMLTNALILSNVFVRLSTQRNKLLPYFSSLPISMQSIFVSDFTVTGLSLIIANLPIFITANYIMGTKVTPSQLTYGFTAPIIFLAMTYIPQLRFKKYGFVISLLIMSFFIEFSYSLFASAK
jgi:hypothetical protein